jgi:hypothetical protein
VSCAFSCAAQRINCASLVKLNGCRHVDTESAEGPKPGWSVLAVKSKVCQNCKQKFTDLPGAIACLSLRHRLRRVRQRQARKVAQV